MLRFEWFESLKKSTVQQLCQTRGLDEVGSRDCLMNRLEDFENDPALKKSIDFNDTTKHKWNVKQLQCEVRARGLTGKQKRKEELRELLKSGITHEQQQLMSMISSVYDQELNDSFDFDLNESINRKLNRSATMDRSMNMSIIGNEKLHSKVSNFDKLQQCIKIFNQHLKTRSETILEQSQYDVDFTVKKEPSQAKMNNLNREFLVQREWENVIGKLRDCRDQILEMRETVEDFLCDDFDRPDEDEQNFNDYLQVKYLGNEKRKQNMNAMQDDAFDEQEEEEEEEDDGDEMEGDADTVFVVYDSNARKILIQDATVLVSVFDTNEDAEQFLDDAENANDGIGENYGFAIQEKDINEWYDHYHN